MKVITTDIPDLVIIEPTVHGDHRGWFMETYSKASFDAAGLSGYNFIQDNQSMSATKGTLRGMHYQLAPNAQAKLVRCTKGEIFDAVIDLRTDSPTFKQWFGIKLTEENKTQLLVPKGFAHGFMTLTDNVEVQYKVDGLYAQADERSILWNDPEIGIEWPLDVEPVISEKDEKAPTFAEAEIK